MVLIGNLNQKHATLKLFPQMNFFHSKWHLKVSCIWYDIYTCSHIRNCVELNYLLCSVHYSIIVLIKQYMGQGMNTVVLIADF